ncbi:MAG: DUF2244 domain-containing protein [Caldimonas sp.]
MSSLSVQPFGQGSPAAALRFGKASGVGGAGGSVQWLLLRNCSLTPIQLLAFYLSLCVWSLAIAGAFWWRGATLVMPFASLELLAVGAALFVYARHTGDRERVVLQPGRLTVECRLGNRTDQVEFAPAWVRVEPAHGDRSLIEISGEGKRVAIGRFVRPELRRALADELRSALRGSGVASAAGDGGAPRAA